MQPEVRREYNRQFTIRTLPGISRIPLLEAVNHAPPFRIAETPVFVPKGIETVTGTGL